MSIERYDIIVIGGGHAGCEAAFAAARMGVSTLLLSMNLDHIALMSCNPSIGGLAKGHLVREIDALGGLMGLAADNTGIQFRMLNTSKGPAVRAPRAQCDKARYSRWVKQFLENVENLALRQGTVKRLLWKSDGQSPCICGVELETGEQLACRAVIVTTGTFLDGLIHIGDRSVPAGRAGENAAIGLSDSLRELGLTTARLKTGTPPRLDKRSIQWEILEPQYGDDPPPFFSYLTEKTVLPQVPCYLTYTNAETHKIILDNLSRSAMYGGYIKSVGPRYCPSIEDKCVRFADKERHQVFLEPEGLDTNEIYVNGVSTSLPEEVQREFIHTIRGLEHARITRVGYAIEYTYVPPSQLTASLEVRGVRGLFLAGQINGTTGYEEAAAQGLVAGVNAVLSLRDEPPFILKRNEAYIGVLIDDLITKEHSEPYRMFTSRAEFRLLLRQDNADLRLTEKAYQLGLVSAERYELFCKYRSIIHQELERLKATHIRPSELDAELASQYELNNLKKGISLWQFLSRPEIHFTDLLNLGYASSLQTGPSELPESWLNRAREQIELLVKYDGYLERQQAQVERMSRLESLALPPTLDYANLRGLRKEAALKLAAKKPATIGQALRIAGVNPADIGVLLLYLREHSVPSSSESVHTPPTETI
ncbi:MAG: tRNA uridine-5-carboxymethylaminomethyl(34) synthesis enzyme MnmG [Candidatus Hydrogenedentota bacterium]|jgi:tRNA uridine 5-carboxymethylaminomethyl modification enzyme|uniref:tRNA uridine 5-carboxymethylaminomethyl modification enzyme MnmG n=1 Tax=Sumerlaea chitinivorans TaxID=2250252 RepID=A0A2Z4Y3V1_SUMC1|nr:tRNA uridine 5-carboxymethylaminomethyl modification enzyme GidA [Candidatus Sumerlaea chitinivorans]RMH28920.1 MAG: tRNA uridine-5-carboxymethylaminomethyl(34) synthesis enzyme MnmG [Candidatus Hydrogenedentota bacterium]